MKVWVGLYLLVAGYYLAHPAFPPSVSPLGVCALFLGGAVLLSENERRLRWGVFLREILVRAAVVIGSLISIGFLCWRVFARVHELPPAFGSAISGLLRVSGLRSSCPRSDLVLVDDGSLWTLFANTPELFQIQFALLLVAAVAVYSFSVAAPLRTVLAAAGVILGWSVLRTALVVCLTLDLGTEIPMWSRLWTTVTYLPVVVVLPTVLKLPPWNATSFHWSREYPIIIFLTFLLGFSTFFSFPAEAKSGRILMDDYHSDWEWSTEVYDTETFGRRSNYNYNFMVQLLEQAWEVHVNQEPITPMALNEYDVLIVKTPTKDFSSTEISTITAWVRQGGGLLVLGDHTNLFGMSTRLNSVMEPYGISFNFDATYDLTSGALSTWSPQWSPGPVTEDVDHIRFATSCTISGSLLCDDIITGMSLGCDEMDFSNPGFFGDMSFGPEDRFGSFLQAVAVNSGRGRVLAFSDSTVFSNFDACMPGKRELLFGMIRYLNCTSMGQLPRQICWFVAFAGLLTVVSWRAAHVRRLGLILGALFLMAGSALGPMVDRTLTPRAILHAPMPSIGFAVQGCGYWLPSLLDTDLEHPELAYDTFFVWTQRIQAVPQLVDLRTLPRECTGVVVINPLRGPTAAEAGSLVDFVHRGGRVLLMDSEMVNPQTHVPAWLDALGSRSGEVPDGDDLSGYGENALRGDPEVRFNSIGSGAVAIHTDSKLFSRLELGHIDDWPSEERLSSFAKVFSTLRWLAAGYDEPE